MARVANGENAVEIQCWFCSQSLWKAGLLRNESHTGFALRSCMVTAFDGLNSLSRSPFSLRLLGEWVAFVRVKQRLRRGISIAILRRPQRLQRPCRALFRVELRDNACAIGQHRCVTS
jgi:hypothetical protein